MRRLRTLGPCVSIFVLALAASASAAPNVTNATQKGSLLIWPDIRVDDGWNTLIRIQNDGSSTSTSSATGWTATRTAWTSRPGHAEPGGLVRRADGQRHLPGESVPPAGRPTGSTTVSAGRRPEAVHGRGLLACWAADDGTQQPGEVEPPHWYGDGLPAGLARMSTARTRSSLRRVSTSNRSARRDTESRRRRLRRVPVVSGRLHHAGRGCSLTLRGTSRSYRTSASARTRAHSLLASPWKPAGPSSSWTRTGAPVAVVR